MAFRLPAWSNRAYYPEGFKSKKIQDALLRLSEREFKEQFAGLLVPPAGLVFKDFGEAHVVPVHWGGPQPIPGGEKFFWLPPEQRFELWIDPGYSGSAYNVTVGCRVGETLVAYDEVYLRGYTAPEMIDVCQGKPWWGRLDRIIMDVAGTYHQMGQETNAAVWRKATGLNVWARKVPIQQGLDRMYWLLRPHPDTRLPRFVVNGTTCPNLVREFTEGYRWPTDSDGQRREGGHVVPIDRDCDAIKACIYAGMAHYGPTLAVRQRRPRVSYMPVLGR